MDNEELSRKKREYYQSHKEQYKKKIFSGVYEIVNIVNGKRYIGSAKYLKVRKGTHFCDLRKGKHGNKHLQNAFDLYGEDSLRFNIIIRCDPEMQRWFEQKCIDELKPEYNIAPLATGGNSGIITDEQRSIISMVQRNRVRGPVSEETRRRMSESQRGKKMPPLSDERKQYLRTLRLGKKQSPEAIEKTASKLRGRKHPNYFSSKTKRNLSDINFGKSKHSDETKAKISEYWTGRKRSEEQKLNMGKRKIDESTAFEMYDMKENQHMTVREIMRATGIDVSYAQACLVLSGKSHVLSYKKYHDKPARLGTDNNHYAEEGLVWARELNNGCVKRYEEVLGL